MSEAVLTEMEYRRNRAAKLLFDRIMQFCRGKFMTKRLIEEVEQLVYDHRSQCKAKGIDFPRLTVFPLVEQGAVHTFNADLDEQGIQTAILNMTVQYPAVTAADLANGCRHAFPHYKAVDNLNFERPATVKLAS